MASEVHNCFYLVFHNCSLVGLFLCCVGSPKQVTQERVKDFGERMVVQTQNEWVLEQLQKGRRLTPKEAMDERGVMRLGARIYELKQAGHFIATEMVEVSNRYGQTCHVAQYIYKLDPSKHRYIQYRRSIELIRIMIKEARLRK